MEKNKNNTWIWIVVAIIIVVIIFFISKNKKSIDPAITPSNEFVGEPAESVQDTTEVTGTGSVSISYTNALIKYADRRIQLDGACRAFPSNVTYKDNTGIMIDNRSPNTRTVKVGDNYTIKPWGFKIVVLPDIYLKSKTLLVDCDKSQNVATILVQE